MNRTISTQLQKLPKAYQRKATKIINSISNGNPYQDFRGKRLQFDRNTIGIPLGNHYRLLLKQEQRNISICRVLTHAEYDKTIK